MKKVFSVLFLFTLLLAGCRRPARSGQEDAGSAPPPEGLHGRVTVKGSDSMVALGLRWAERFSQAHPGVSVQVTGGGSGTGLAALLNGTTDIAMSSRPLEDDEARRWTERHAQAPVGIAVARDVLTFYVHEANPVAALSLEQLAGIYQGDITRWSEVGGRDAPIVVYSRESSSGTYAFMKKELLGGQDFTERAQALPGTSAVVDAVSQEMNGIGYGGVAAARGSVKVLQVKNPGTGLPVAPTLEHLRDGTYPLVRPLTLYFPGPPSGPARAFLEDVLSPEGQRIVTQVGYFPVE